MNNFANLRRVKTIKRIVADHHIELRVSKELINLDHATLAYLQILLLAEFHGIGGEIKALQVLISCASQVCQHTAGAASCIQHPYSFIGVAGFHTGADLLVQGQVAPVQIVNRGHFLSGKYQALLIIVFEKG